ncbi:MAG: Ig-like domain-containing protein [Acidimicrobiales bacterium]
MTAGRRGLLRWRLGRAGAGLLMLAGIVVTMVVNAPAASAGTPTWTQLSPATSPPALEAPSMAYDASTHQLVLTGEAAGDTDNETWIWNGSTWSDANPATSPPARFGAAMAYDSSTGDIVLFGGTGAGGLRQDTWTWDGSTWSQATPASPPSAREGAEMAYDTATSQMVLFGGYDGSNYLADTWTWSGTSWTQVGLSEPGNFTGKEFPAVAYDPATSQLLLFSGWGQNQYSDTWDWNGTSWNQLTPGETPFASGGDAMAYDPDLSQLVLFGGNTSPDDSYDADTNGVFYWDGSTFGTLATGPSARDFAALAYDPDSSQLVMFGGNDSSGTYLNDTWSYSLVPTVATTLSVGSPTVAGVETVPESAIPASSVDGSSGSGDAASAPLSSIPLHSIGIGSSPLSSIPLHSIPLHSIAVPGSGAPSALATAEQALSNTLLSDISIDFPSGCENGGETCTGWQGVLAGSQYAGVPLEAVTLGDVLLDTNLGSDGEPSPATNFGSVDLGDLDLSSSSLSSIPLSSVELGSVPLGAIGLSGSAPGTSAVDAWCSELASLNSSCSDFGIDQSTGNDNGVTLLSLALAGLPLHSIPLSSIPLSSIDLSSVPLSSIPLSSIPLSSIDLASNPLHSIPLHSIPLSSIPLHSIELTSIPDLSLVVNCQIFTCAGATLGDAAAAGAILTSATVGDLPTDQLSGTSLAQLLIGDSTSDPDYPSLTLGDVLLSTLPPASYPWQSVSMSGLPLAADESAGGTVTYTLTLNLSNGPGTVLVDLTLPPGFSYVHDSANWSDGQLIDPTPAGSSLYWALALEPGVYPITFEATAGTGLGAATATVSSSISGVLNSSASASVNVIDGEEPDDTAALATPLDPGTPPGAGGNLNIGYLTSKGDVNDWAVTVTQGEELALALTNLPATYDLELFGPDGQQLQTAPDQSVPGVSDSLPSITPGATSESTPGSQDLAVTAPAGDQLEAVSNNPDAQSQYIQTPPLPAGTYIVQVSGYNGAYSPQPYLLQANVLGGATSPTCSPIQYPNPLPDAGQGPVSFPDTVPPGTNTLFLVNTQRLSAAFGSTDEAQILADAESVASDSSAGVSGAVIAVDSYASVQSAYALWNSNPCSVDAANGVVAAIASVVDSIREANASIQNVVIVGADDQIPFARLADGATESNERDYGASTFAGENNVEGDALSLGYYFSDDPYVASQPLTVGSATLYDPELAVGRLVESSSEIESSLMRFVQTGGDLNATASLTTGYSFLTSGAEAVSANLAADGLSPSTLINESWTTSDLDAALGASPTPGVDSINAHFDYSRALPAADNASGDETDLFTTTDVRNALGSYAGRLLFSMGCHSGLDIDDAEVGSPGSAPVDDWAKTFADAGALWVANTGYGYADTDTIAYSAKLMSDFAANLNGSLTIGEAMTEAKQQYAGGNAILSPYDLKALMESTFYGLPMYNLNSSSTPVAPPTGPPTGTDPVTGLTVAPVALSLGQGSSTVPGQLGLVSTPNGSYYQINGTTPTDSGTQVTEYRPIEPLVTLPMTEPGLVAHGALVTALTSTDEAFAPAYSMPSAGSADDTPPAIADAAFPGTLQRVADFSTFTPTGTGEGAQLDLVAGQFFPNGSSSGAGTERLFNSMSAEVYYLPPNSPDASDYTPATIDSTEAIEAGSNVNFVVQVTPALAPVVRVLVLSTDADDPGAWTPLDLSSSDGLRWSGAAPSTTSGKVQYIVEAVDAAGNVSVSNNEGTAFDGTTPPSSTAPDVSISLSGSGGGGGYYSSAVTATVTAPAGSTYVLDGAGSAPVPESGTITITSNGEHVLSVTDPVGGTTTQSFAISIPNTQTTTALTASTGSPTVGQAVALSAQVSPDGAGAGSPSGNVEFLDGSTPVESCGGSSGEPLTGTIATCSVSYDSPGSHRLTAVYLGGGTFTGSTSGPQDLAVILPTAFSVMVNGGSSATIAYGTPATLSESGIQSEASGVVTFYASGGTVLCSFASSGGATSCTTPATLAAQSYTGIYGSFGDTDGSYASSSSTNNVSLTVVGPTQFSITVNGGASASTTYGSGATGAPERSHRHGVVLQAGRQEVVFLHRQRRRRELLDIGTAAGARSHGHLRHVHRH